MGKWMAEQGHDLVFGGCNIGLMNTIGKAVKAHGGRAIGVVPTIVERGGKTFPDLDVEIPCDNLSDRKDSLLSQSDIVVALPAASALSTKSSPLLPPTPSAITAKR